MTENSISTLAIAALSSAPLVGPARLRWLLSHDEPIKVFSQMQIGTLPFDRASAPSGVSESHLHQWAAHLRSISLDQLGERYSSMGVKILTAEDALWPFSEDKEAPSLLFALGDTRLLSVTPRVGIVGTRRCTSIGRKVAYQMGVGLAQAGVTVVSGLALGIDGASHRGVCNAGGAAIAVVGSGLDIVYPRGNSELWEQISREGLLLTESPLGASPERWRFPARNRLIAGLIDGLVVVESHKKGGSLITVDEALERDCVIMSVPGSTVSSASKGSNLLLRDGAIPVLDVEDILAHLPSESFSNNSRVGKVSVFEKTTELSTIAKSILLEVQSGDVHIDRLIEICKAKPYIVLSEVQELVARKIVHLDGSTVCLVDESSSL